MATKEQEYEAMRELEHSEKKKHIAKKMKKSHLGKLLHKPEYKKANKKFDIKGYEEMMK